VEESPLNGLSATAAAGFNGATAMKPWKRLILRWHCRRQVRLQWGHGDEAVEEVGRAVLLLLGDLASMGPRR